MSNKVTGLFVAIALVLVAIYGGTTLAVIAGIVTGLTLIGVLKYEGAPSKVLNILALVGIVVLGGFIPAEWGAEAPTLRVPSQGAPEQPAAQAGQMANAILKLNVKDQTGATYAGSGTIYALKSGVVTDRNDLMKKVYDGNTADLTPNSMALTSGVYQFNGFGGKIGDTVTFAGYRDATPGAAENISFTKTATLVGITAGSTPEWMLDNAQYVWYNYPTLLYYDSSDSAKSNYTEDEDSAIEKTFTFYMFPTNNGEQWIDSSLYIEAPSSNAGAFKKIKITSPEGQIVEYTSLQSTGQMSSSDPRFIAAPSLTTSTDTMYYVGKFPTDSIRTSTSQKAKMNVEVTYDHMATAAVVLSYFKVTSNSNALTVSGGHYDSPSTNLKLNMTTTGTDGWDTGQ